MAWKSGPMWPGVIIIWPGKSGQIWTEYPGRFGPEIQNNLVWKSYQSGLEIRTNLAWKSGQMLTRNLVKCGLEIWSNVAWKVLANLAWSLA